MPSVKAKFRPSMTVRQEGVVIYQIIHDRKVRQWSSKFRIREEEWDMKHSTIRIPQESLRRDYLSAVRQQVRWDIMRFEKIINDFVKKGDCFSTDNIIEEFAAQIENRYFLNFMESIISRLRENGKMRTSETYTATLNSFRKFLKDRDIAFDGFNSDLMEDYQSFLQGNGLVPNTISFHMRILRAVFNRAVEKDLAEDTKPFRRVYTGVEKTTKRALSINLIQKIMTINLDDESKECYARDIFMLSFYFRGMSFIDMALLKKTDLKNGYLQYRRRKTGQFLSIAWTKEMQTILDRYPKNKTPYLLPIISEDNIFLVSQYRRKQYEINKFLKKLGTKIGIPIPLTLYCSRHSWASIAKSKGIPISVISDGLGHDSEHTTQIYLSTLDTSAVDKANALIIKTLTKSFKNSRINRDLNSQSS